MTQQWSDYRVFWREFRQTYHDTGAVLPSGPALARALSRYVIDGHSKGESAGDAEAAVSERQPYVGRRILEVGPGTGAVTAAIVAAMRPGDRLDLVERNERFVARLRSRLANDAAFRKAADRVQLIHASVEDLPEDRPYDVIVSGLPFNNFAPELVQGILEKLRRLLAPQGVLSFFEYIAIRRVKSVICSRDERLRLHGVEHALAGVLGKHEINRDMVLLNAPPAWVHHVRWGG